MKLLFYVFYNQFVTHICSLFIYVHFYKKLNSSNISLTKFKLKISVKIQILQSLIYASLQKGFRNFFYEIISISGF